MPNSRELRKTPFYNCHTLVCSRSKKNPYGLLPGEINVCGLEKGLNVILGVRTVYISVRQCHQPHQFSARKVVAILTRSSSCI